MNRSPKHPGIRLKPSQLQPATVMLRSMERMLEADRAEINKLYREMEISPSEVKFIGPFKEAAE